MNIHYKFAPWCLVIVYLSGHRASPYSLAFAKRPTRTPHPVVPHPESLAAQAAYAEALLPRSARARISLHAHSAFGFLFTK